jgi:deoxyribodipyrimidine photo-lyase
MKKNVTIFWFRRDLRLDDNAALYHALKQHSNVLPLFIFDTTILDQLENKSDRRVQFIHQEITQLAHTLKTEYKAQGFCAIMVSH